MRARCRLRREKHETRRWPTGRRGGGARADHRRAAAEHEPVPQHRVVGGGSSSSGTAVGLSVSRCFDSRLLPVRHCGRRVQFISSVHLFLPHTVTGSVFCPFSFWRHHVIVPSRFFVTYPHGSSPFDRTAIIINRPYPVHVVNTVRF